MQMPNVANRYLGFICFVLGFFLVYLLKPVLLPLVIALFMIAVALPINTLLNAIFPKHVSYILSYVALIAILGTFCAITYVAIAQFTSHVPEYEAQFFSLWQKIRAWLQGFGLPVPREFSDERLQQFATSGIEIFYTTLGHTALIIALVVLGLPELVYWEDKLENCLGKNDGGKWGTAAGDAAKSFQKYMTVTTMIGVIASGLTAGFCWAVGLDFALLWGLLAFVMNFIPVLGAMLMILPPTFMAMMQFTDPWQIWTIFIGMTIIQFIMGNVIDPKFQGKYLSMSPVVILISIAFWSFLWGVPGAFLAVPLTHIFMVGCYQFPHMKRVACLLSEGKGSKTINHCK